MTEERLTRTERMRQEKKRGKKPTKAEKPAKEAKVKKEKPQKQGKKKRKGGFSWRIFLAVLLFLAAAVLFLLDPIKNYLVRQGQETNAVTELNRDKRAEIESNEKKEVSYDFGVIKPLNPYDVIANGVNPKDLPTVGGVAMPDVGMNLPIYKGVTNEGMYLGAGTLMPNQKMGESNYAIASHHSIHKGLLFEPLMHAKVGQAVYLTDLDKVYKYEINYIDEVDPSRVDLIEPTANPILTMVTCDSSLTMRVVVQAKLVDTKPIEEATSEMVKAFEAKQTIPTNN